MRTTSGVGSAPPARLESSTSSCGGDVMLWNENMIKNEATERSIDRQQQTRDECMRKDRSHEMKGGGPEAKKQKTRGVARANPTQRVRNYFHVYMDSKKKITVTDCRIGSASGDRQHRRHMYFYTPVVPSPVGPDSSLPHALLLSR